MDFKEFLKKILLKVEKLHTKKKEKKKKTCLEQDYGTSSSLGGTLPTELRME